MKILCFDGYKVSSIIPEVNDDQVTHVELDERTVDALLGGVEVVGDGAHKTTIEDRAVDRRLFL